MEKTIRIYKIPRVLSWNLFIKDQTNIPVATEVSLNWQQVATGVFVARIEELETGSLTSYSYCQLDGVFGTYSVSLISNRIYSITVDTRVEELYSALDTLKDTVDYWNLDLMDYENSLNNLINVAGLGQLPEVNEVYEFYDDYFDGKTPTIKWLICHFIPAADGKVKFSYKGKDIEVDLSSLQYSVLTNNGTVVMVFPINLTKSNNKISINWNSSWTRIDDTVYQVMDLKTILSSAQLKSAHLCPFDLNGITTNSDNNYSLVTGYFSYTTLTVGEDKFIFLLMNQAEARHTLTKFILDDSIFGDDINKVAKSIKVTLNLLGARITFTYSDFIYYKLAGITKLDIWMDFSSTDLLVCWFDYNGVFNKVPAQCNLPLIIDNWQQYLAQNPNYKDMLYNVPIQQAKNQYDLAQNINEQNYQYNWDSKNNYINWTSKGPFDLMRDRVDLTNSKMEKDMVDKQNKFEYQTNLSNIRAQADAQIAMMKAGPSQIQSNGSTLTAGALTKDFTLQLGFVFTSVPQFYRNSIQKLFNQNGVSLIGSITKQAFKNLLAKDSFRISINNMQMQLLQFLDKITDYSLQQIFYCKDYNTYITQINNITK